MPDNLDAREEFTRDLDAFIDHWDSTEDTDSHQMDEAADLAARALTLADPTDTAGIERLAAAITYWESLDEHDLDAAIDLINATTSLRLA